MSLITSTLDLKKNGVTHTLSASEDGHVTLSKGEAEVLSVKDDGIVISSPSSVWNDDNGSLVSQLLLSKLIPTIFKVNDKTPMFIKTGAQTISIAAGNKVLHKGRLITYSIDTPVTVIGGFSSVGKDYSIYVRDDGTLYAVLDMKSAPYTSALGDTKLGGFHYGAVTATETVDSGLFATTGVGHIWTQTDVDNLKGINKFSIWDLEYRPKCDPRGMTCVAGQFWVDIYLCGTQHITNGTSMYGSDVASSTVLPTIPLEFGGNGEKKYTTLNWYDASEIASSHGKSLIPYKEFPMVAFGVTESQSIGGTSSTIAATLRQAGYTSKFGVEQVTGNHNIWGADIFSVGGTNVLDVVGRGKVTGQPLTVTLGGSRASGTNSGSRSGDFGSFASGNLSSIGLRAKCDFK